MLYLALPVFRNCLHSLSKAVHPTRLKEQTLVNLDATPVVVFLIDAIGLLFSPTCFQGGTRISVALVHNHFAKRLVDTESRNNTMLF